MLFNKANKRFTKEKAIAYFEKCASDAGVQLPTLKAEQICLVQDHSDTAEGDGSDFEDSVAE